MVLYSRFCLVTWPYSKQLMYHEHAANLGIGCVLTDAYTKIMRLFCLFILINSVVGVG